MDPSDYRLISITTPFSKVLENCLHKQTTAHAENPVKLTPFQLGFRSKVSAQDAFLYFIETIQHEIEIGNIVHAILLDLSKTFDSLSHQILLKKPSAIKLVGIFLSGPLQQVSVNGVQSE